MDIRRRSDTGLPYRIRGSFKLQALTPGEEEARVREFLLQNCSVFRVDSSFQNLKFVEIKTSPVYRSLWFQQTLHEIPIFGGNVHVFIDSDDFVRQINIENPTATSPVLTPTNALTLTPGETRNRVMTALGTPSLRYDPVDPKLFYFLGAAGLKLSYRIVVPTQDFHDWEIMADAYSGEILQKNDLTCFAHG